MHSCMQDGGSVVHDLDTEEPALGAAADPCRLTFDSYKILTL